MFLLLTGRPPFLERSDRSYDDQHLYDPPPRVSEFVDHVDPAIDAIVDRMLAKAPESRPTAEEVIAVLAPHLPQPGDAAPNPALDPDPTLPFRSPDGRERPAETERAPRRGRGRRRPEVDRPSRDEYDDLIAQAADEIEAGEPGPATERLDATLEEARRAWGSATCPSRGRACAAGTRPASKASSRAPGPATGTPSGRQAWNQTREGWRSFWRRGSASPNASYPRTTSMRPLPPGRPSPVTCWPSSPSRPYLSDGCGRSRSNSRNAAGARDPGTPGPASRRLGAAWAQVSGREEPAERVAERRPGLGQRAQRPRERGQLAEELPVVPLFVQRQPGHLETPDVDAGRRGRVPAARRAFSRVRRQPARYQGSSCSGSGRTAMSCGPRTTCSGSCTQASKARWAPPRRCRRARRR